MSIRGKGRLGGCGYSAAVLRHRDDATSFNLRLIYGRKIHIKPPLLIGYGIYKFGDSCNMEVSFNRQMT